MDYVLRGKFGQRMVIAINIVKRFPLLQQVHCICCERSHGAVDMVCCDIVQLFKDLGIVIIIIIIMLNRKEHQTKYLR